MRRLPPPGARSLRAARVLALVLLALVTFAGCSGDDAESGPPEDRAYREPPADAVDAPDFTGTSVAGESLTASELWAERPLVLVFTASWCETCVGVHRDAIDAVDGYDGAIDLLGVVGDDDEDVSDYADEIGSDRPIAVVGQDVWLDYAAREPPLVVLVARGGKVLRGWPGGFEEDAFAEALDGLFVESGDQGR